MNLPPASEIVAWLAIAAAVATFLRWLGRKIRRAVVTLDAIERVVTKELSPNHGSSMKDDVANTAISLHTTNQRIDDLHVTLRSLADANHLIWPAIEAVAKAHPPEED